MYNAYLVLEALFSPNLHVFCSDLLSGIVMIATTLVCVQKPKAIVSLAVTPGWPLMTNQSALRVAYLPIFLLFFTKSTARYPQEKLRGKHTVDLTVTKLDVTVLPLWVIVFTR